MVEDYIKYIRGMVGGKEIISVGLAVVIFNEKNEVLLEKRSDNGLYCVPGGSLDIGETVIEGAKREVYEETGLELGQLTLAMINSGPDNKLIYPNGDITHYVDLVFIAQVENKTPKKEDEESKEIRFFKLTELPDESEFLRGNRHIIDYCAHFKGIVAVN